MSHPTADALLEDSLSAGAADPDVHAHVEGCALCSEERDALRGAFELLGLATEARLPNAGEPARLAAALAHRPRFVRFVPRVAELCGISSEAARIWLARIDEDPGAWEVTDVPGMSVLELPAELDAARSCRPSALLVRIARGHHIPEHTHAGRETTLCLQGRIDDGRGPILPGGEIVMQPGSAHAVTLLHGPAAIALVVTVLDPEA